MKLNFIFILSIILLVIILPVKSSIITYEENQVKTPNVMNIKNFDDGTIVIRISRVNYTAPPRTCLEEFFSIRTIYPNGTINEFDISLDIQPFNFCILPKVNPLKFYPVKKNLLFVTFLVAADVNNPYSYDDWGMVVDLDGVIYNKTKLGPSFVDPNTNEWSPAGQDSITLNVHRDDGFLRTTPITNSTGFALQQYKIDKNNNIQLLKENVIEYPMGHPIETVATANGGYAIIYPNIIKSTTSFSSRMKLYGIFLEYENDIIQGPVILYQTQASILEVTLLNCDLDYIGVGQTCILTLNIAQDQNTFVKVDFLSSGTAYDVKAFQSPSSANYNIKSLRYGGYFLYYTLPIINDANKLNLYGFILDNNGMQHSWSLPYPTLTNSEADITILPNNTLIIPQPEVGQSWSLISIALSRIKGERDNSFENLQISTTFPEVNAIIDPSKTKLLTIKYYDKVDLLPNHNVTILQDDGTGNGIIRQITSMSVNNGEFVRYIDDSTIEITVIDSTFNQPNAKYYILIDNGFVKNRNYQEPIIGIQNSGWSFITKNDSSVSSKFNLKKKFKEVVNSTDINGKVRLTTDGTSYFKSIKHDKIKHKEFFDNLRLELAKAIPVSSERITTSGRHQIDTTVSPEQYILSINIKKAKNKGERSVNSIVEDLNTLIKNKLITVIGSGSYSNYLDHEYGYKTIPRWIEINLKKSIVSMIIIFLLILTLLFNSFEIYECGTSIVKFTTTILFTSRDAGAVENIFTTSLFFLTFPFIVNLGFAFIIVINELTRFDSDDREKLLKNIQYLTKILDNNDDLLEKGNNHSETDNETTIELNKISDRKGKLQKVNELTEELKNVRIELEKFKEDLNGFKEITKNLKIVNDLINKLISPDGISLKEVKSVMENLEKIKKLIKDIDQVEDFKEELKEIFNFVKELKEVYCIIEHIINEKGLKNEVKEELNKASKLQVKLKADLSKDLKKVDKLIKELEQININIEEFIEESKKANDLMKELEEIISKLKEELKKAKELKEDLTEARKHIIDLGIKNEEELFNKHQLIEGLEEVTKFMKFIESIQVELSPSTDDDYVKDKSLQYYYIHIKESEDCNCWSYFYEGSKELIHNIKDIKVNIMVTIKKKIYGEKPEQKYRKFSKWLKDYRNNNIVIVIFTILAGINISHLKLLGSTLKIQKKRLDWLKSIIPINPERILNPNFNARLSYAAKRKLFWGSVTNVFIADLTGIFIQSFYVSQAVSVGYTPIYTMLNSVFHLINNLLRIYEYKSEGEITGKYSWVNFIVPYLKPIVGPCIKCIKKIMSIDD
ncbi:hypothetical protein RhiirA4_468374 [Rhizophagus irregularis]|uniref:Uncharacterized protein n=1 Tax=Rhizophagus irregularis TaxID=588596 RepID=A0A2I1GXN1_9GLOM|nr:hypothetical protein RhiirA4_468374 [Rhizophagus irregularis]